MPDLSLIWSGAAPASDSVPRASKPRSRTPGSVTFSLTHPEAFLPSKCHPISDTKVSPKYETGPGLSPGF
jgi:hypothetical protein